MKFRVERDVLAESVAWAARSLPSRPSVPILAGLLLEASDGVLTLSGFDYETSVRVSVPAQVAAAGRCLVSGRLVAEIAKSLPAQPVEVSVEGARAQLVCGSSRFTLQTLPTEEYPALPQLPAASGTVASAVFAQAVAQVVTAAGREDTLPVLTGVRMEIEGSTMALLATDRYRLAVRELQWSPQAPDAVAAALVPARVLAETAKAMTGTEIVVAWGTAGAGEGFVGFVGVVGGGQRRATTRLLDGEFPKVRGIIPAAGAIATRVRVETATLVEAVRRVALVAERNAPVRLTFAAEAVREPVTVGFNPVYLLDGLTAIGTPVAQLAFTQATKPAELTGAKDFDDDPITDFRYVLMPVRLNS